MIRWSTVFGTLLVFIVGPALATLKDAPPLAATDYQKLLKTEVSILEAMDDLDENLRRRSDDLEKLQTKRQRIAVHLVELEVRFEEATQVLAAARSRIQKRLGSIVRMRRTSSADYLLDPHASLLASLRERVLRLMLESDRQRISLYREQLENYEVEYALLDSKRAELDQMEAEVASAKGKLDKDRKDRTEILRLVNEEQQFYEKAYADLARANADLTSRISRLHRWKEKRLGFLELKGGLRLPMSYARIFTPYGERRNARLRTVTMHKGLEIKSRGSESVRAVYWGRVAFVGKLRGYGTAIIVDHTEGYHTIYSRLKTVLVHSGDVVESRQVLGTIGGASALGSPNTLYFELREAGLPIDPTGWFM